MMPQLPGATPAWSNRAGTHAAVVWQPSHSSVVWMCVACLPVAVVPSWQPAQAPRTSAWSTRVTGTQALVTWQASQLPVEAMCCGFLPVALMPSWHWMQVPAMTRE